MITIGVILACIGAFIIIASNNDRNIAIGLVLVIIAGIFLRIF